MLPNYNMFGTGFGNNTQQYITTPQMPQSVQPTQQAYPNQYGTMQQYAPQQESIQNGFIVVNGEDEAMMSKYPMNTPLFDSTEDVFYFKTYDQNGMHVVLNKNRFYRIENDVADVTPLIEQKDMTYGDSASNNEIETLKKSIEDLTGQINALVELQLENQTAPDTDKTTKSSSATRKSGNK